MRLPIIGKNQNIVQIYNQEFIKISPEDIMHEGLKNRWSIRESEWHHKLFKMAFGRIKRSFPFITLLNTNKIICPPKINLRKPTSSLNPSKQIGKQSYGILMWTLFSREEPYHGRDAADIRRLVGEGQRPRISDVDEHSEVKMVPEAKDLMIRCWNQNAENRPSFHECTVFTAMMFDAYKDEVIDAGRSVENLLNKKPSQDELLDIFETLEDPSLSAESFIRAPNAIPLRKRHSAATKRASGSTLRLFSFPTCPRY
ncbi:unnamed protein product [Ranitomeya imitator]|uniref:Protein kinase domain-containing protein n=1 Tax=Ranitomeya imitator TaxID=111125 RepID=A0ABN9MEM5_9NEOB|nr:unnamed protein product [Ranitomeya imitator]